MNELHVLKGHGTENDFVLVPDLDGRLDLSPALVRALCDRRAGIGADGVLRVVRSESHDEGKPMAGEAPFFMDYRNADGSLAEMCGNGVRVFARYLQRAGLVEDETLVATRGGARQTVLLADGTVSVEMGAPHLLDVQPQVSVGSQLQVEHAVALEIPNPHVVVPVADAATLAGLELHRAPIVQAPLPHGQNVEFVLREARRHLRMRVHERGVGETRSCGTGICAAVVASAISDGASSGDGSQWRVDVPGGTCMVTWRADGTVLMSGPAVLVAEIDLAPAWLAAV